MLQYETLTRETDAVLPQAEEAGSDLSLWAAMAGVTANGLTRESAVAQFHMMRSEELLLGGSVEQLSGREFDESEGFGPGRLREQLLVGGMGAVVEALAAGDVALNDGAPSLEVLVPTASVPAAAALDVQRGHRVTRVVHGDGQVVLHTEETSSPRLPLPRLS